jgi:hypothetical protein
VLSSLCCNHSTITQPQTLTAALFCDAFLSYLAEQQDLQWKPSSELEALPSRELSGSAAAAAAAAAGGSGGLQSMSSAQIKYMRQQSLVPLYIAGAARSNFTRYGLCCHTPVFLPTCTASLNAPY